MKKIICGASYGTVLLPPIVSILCLLGMLLELIPQQSVFKTVALISAMLSLLLMVMSLLRDLRRKLSKQAKKRY